MLNINTEVGILPVPNRPIAVTQSGAWSISATQSGTWNVNVTSGSLAIVAGTAKIGQVAIDQTTDGTTNKVYVGNTVSAAQSGVWTVKAITDPITVNAHAVTQSGVWSIKSITDPVTVGTHAVTQSGIWDIGTLAAITNPVKITDNGGSITVDGAVTVSSIPAIPAGTNKIGSVDIANVADVMFSARLIDYAIADNTATAIEVALPSGYNQAFVEHVIVVPDSDAKMFDFRIYEHRNSGSWYEKECIYFTDDMQGRLDDFSRLYYADAENIGKIHCRVITAAGGGGNYTIKLKGRLMR